MIIAMLKMVDFNVIIQDTWSEEDDQELLEYCKKYKTKILSKKEIMELNVLHIDVLFCATKTVQKVLKTYKCPDTYEKCFQSLYKRHIECITIKECEALKLPYFIKPVANDKSFGAMIIKTMNDLKHVKTFLNPDQQIYISSLVDLKNEYRLFIGDNKLYGMANASEYIAYFLNIDADYLKYFNTAPPADFIDEILRLNNIGFCVVDVALKSDQTWIVVEVNPPFAISSYDLPIKQYFDYCHSAWKHITQTIK
jgi:hypothetical protein